MRNNFLNDRNQIPEGSSYAWVGLSRLWSLQRLADLCGGCRYYFSLFMTLRYYYYDFKPSRISTIVSDLAMPCLPILNVHGLSDKDQFQ
jgi:hypothetical protein